MYYKIDLCITNKHLHGRMHVLLKRKRYNTMWKRKRGKVYNSWYTTLIFVLHSRFINLFLIHVYQSKCLFWQTSSMFNFLVGGAEQSLPLEVLKIIKFAFYIVLYFGKSIRWETNILIRMKFHLTSNEIKLCIHLKYNSNFTCYFFTGKTCKRGIYRKIMRLKTRVCQITTSRSDFSMVIL
jgi:hypothetical protein